jgi:hypothetical protein
MNVVLVFGRKTLSLWSGRYHLAIGLLANMRFGLAMPLESHEGRDSALCPH